MASPLSGLSSSLGKGNFGLDGRGACSFFFFSSICARSFGKKESGSTSPSTSASSSVFAPESGNEIGDSDAVLSWNPNDEGTSDNIEPVVSDDHSQIVDLDG